MTAGGRGDGGADRELVRRAVEIVAAVLGMPPEEVSLETSHETAAS